MVLSVFTTAITTSTINESNNIENTFYSGTKSKDASSDNTKILFVFDDNGTVWVDWYLTIVKDATTVGNVLNRTDVEGDIYFVWDPNQDYILSVLNGTPNTALIEGKGNGPAYSGGNYPQIFNNDTKQFEHYNFDLKNYSAVVWFTGYDSKFLDGETLTSTDISNLGQYLDHGGKLWLCSPELIADLYGVQTGDDRYTFLTFSPTDFLAKYGLIYGAYQDFGTPNTLVGTEKGLTSGLLYQTAAQIIGSADLRVYGDHIVPYTDGATEVFNSTASQTQVSLGWTASLPYIDATQWNNRNPLDSSVSPYKMVFFSFEFTTISTENELVNLMDQVLRYLINIPPRVTVIAPTEGQTISGTFNVNGTSSDTDGTVKRVRIILDGTVILTNITTSLASWSYSFDTTDLANSGHQIMVVAWDGADNSNVSIVNFTVNNAGGNNPPAVNISSPAENALVSGTVAISGTASDPDGNSQLQNVQIKVDSNNWVNATGTTSWSYNLDTTTYTDNVHTISARAFDGSAYSPIVSRNISINNTVVNNVPIVIITYPDEDAILSGVVTISGTAADPDGNFELQGVQIKIDSGNWTNATGKVPWSYSLNTTGYANGAHMISARVSDGSTYSSIVSRNVTILGINNPPTARIVYFPQNVAVGVLVTLDGANSTDPEGYLVTYAWTIDSQPSGSSVSLSNSTANKPTFTPSHEGIYKIKLVVNDGTQDSVPVSVNIIVTAIIKPDIVVSNITFKKDNTAVTSASVNDAITISASIKNIGNANASGVKILFFNGNPSLNGTQVGAEQSIPSLPVNGSYEVSVIYNFMTASNLTVFVVADKDNNISELREDNNELSQTIGVSTLPDAKLPNLKINASDISFTTESGDPLGFVAEGDKIKITVKVYNTKDEDFEGNVSVKFYAGPVSSSNLITSYDGISTISKNSYRIVSYIWNSKQGAPVELYVVVDSGADEFNLTDNVAHKSIFILEKSMVRGDGDTSATPGFEIAALLLAIGIFVLMPRRHKRE